MLKRKSTAICEQQVSGSLLRQFLTRWWLKTCDVCRWYLYENGIPDVVQKRYDNAIAWFKLLIKNPSILGFDADGVEEVKASGGMAVIPNELKDWKDVNNHF